MLATLLDSAKRFMLLSAPFILLYSVALCVSNLSLIRHEGKRLVNVLGILLSFLLVGGLALLFFGDAAASGSLVEVMIHDLLFNLFAALYLYFECMLIGTILSNVIVTRYEPTRDQDYVLILGCGLLAGRIERALAFYRAQIADTGRAPILVPSGGQGPNEVTSECAAMADYLLDRGVPEEHILREDRSTSTFENMKFSKGKMEEREPPRQVAFATTNYHVFRSGMFAFAQGIAAEGIGSPTKRYFWINAFVREFIAALVSEKKKHIVIIALLVLLTALMIIPLYVDFAM